MARYQSTGSQATPKTEGFVVPAEWDRHEACLIAWPYRPGEFPYDAMKAQEAYTRVIKAVSRSEQVLLLTHPGSFTAEHREHLHEEIVGGRVLIINDIHYQNAWSRDVGPTYVRSSDKKTLKAVQWSFNGWGGDPSCFESSKLPRRVCEMQGVEVYSCGLVCEGGALAFDGEGTVITTESVLLNDNRNGTTMDKSEVERVLLDHLGCSKLIWLPEGVHGDNQTFTSGHVDNLVAFVRPGEVVLSWSDDEGDPQHDIAVRAEQILATSVDAKGRLLKVHRLLQPSPPLVLTAEEALACDEGYVEPVLSAGMRLPASYVNFYLSNDHIIVPQFDCETDQVAVDKLKELFPSRCVIGIPNSRQILLGGGCVHCITQQIPATVNLK